MKDQHPDTRTHTQMYARVHAIDQSVFKYNSDVGNFRLDRTRSYRVYMDDNVSIQMFMYLYRCLCICIDYFLRTTSA